MKRSITLLGSALMAATLPACGSATDDAEPTTNVDVEASPLHADGGDQTLALELSCDELLAELHFPDTVFTSATSVAAGEFVQPGQTIPAHCLVTGKMFERVSAVDGQTYAIGFEMRLPLAWKRRFFYQANGGLDGAVVPAIGNTSGGGPLTSALLQGFAVISSDAGHNAMQIPTFGLDPQARLDYGYQAVGKLTPMAKSVIKTAYGKKPRYSYIGGCSNGGRHVMVAAARYPDEYDGYLVGAPGFNLPSAAVANIYGAQQYAPLSGGAVIPGGPFAGLPDLSAAFTPAEQQLLVSKVLERCDALDGVADGMVQRTQACQSTFSLASDVPTCPGARDGTCLTAAQKVAIGNIFSGARTSTGTQFYASFPYDSGHATPDASFWEFIAPLILDSSALAFVMGTPPVDPFTFIPPVYALTSDVDVLLGATFATSGVYAEASQSFMTPPEIADFGKRGRRMIMYHGVSDAIFSANDTADWFESQDQAHGPSAARLYMVPGMTHCAGGPSTDQFDLLTPLVRWVEGGPAPKAVVASVRGITNPGGANFDVPPTWSPDRTRPLCPYPKVAVYRGGNVERAESFVCR
jgi:feruloyl esterase